EIGEKWREWWNLKFKNRFEQSSDQPVPWYRHMMVPSFVGQGNWRSDGAEEKRVIDSEDKAKRC
ncbi:hypothetical protein Tco_0279156, partial [Tanacetum coccineum]